MNTDDNEMQKFIAILLHLGICKLPAMDGYWSMELGYELVADVMSSKRFATVCWVTLILYKIKFVL